MIMGISVFDWAFAAGFWIIVLYFVRVIGKRGWW